MDIEELREPLGEERFTALQTYVGDLIGQRDSARKESINHRQSLKARATELEEENKNLRRMQEELFERLGVESVEQLAELDPKGQAEVAKQYEAKLKRLERDLNEKQEAYAQLDTKHKRTKQDAAMREALGSHEWIDGDLVASYVSGRLAWDDDKVRFQAEDGLLMDLKDGVEALAREKPHLLKSAGPGGSGYRGVRHERDAGPQTMARAEFEALNPAARMTFVKGGGKLSD